MAVLDQLAPASRVAILRLRSLGDCVLSTPAIHLLKQYRPDLEIAVVVEDRFAEVYQGNPDISAVLPPTVGALRAFAPALCLNLHGGTRSARLTLLSGARFRAGFHIFKPGCFYNVRIPTAQQILRVKRRVHTAEHAASAMFHLGVPATEVPRARIFAAPARSIDIPYAVIHAVAATPEKTWPAASFNELAQHVKFKLGLEPIFIGGPGDDLAPFNSFRTIGGAPLADIARLMRDARLFIGNDSGPAHIAAAFGRPVVVLFGPSDSEIWSPWRTTYGLLKAKGPIDSISVESAIAAVTDVLKRTA